MARRTADATHVHVPRVVELHAEAPERWKRFQRAGFHIGVTDGAERTFSILKLLRMTTCARQVIRSTRTFGHRCVRIAPMTKQARQARMISRVVLELRIVEALGKLHLLLGRLWFRKQGGPVNPRVDDRD
jgi:hypothetical protein